MPQQFEPASRPAASSARVFTKPHPVPPFGANGRTTWFDESNTVMLESAAQVTTKSPGYQLAEDPYTQPRSNAATGNGVVPELQDVPVHLLFRMKDGDQIFATPFSPPELCSESGSDVTVGCAGSLPPTSNQRECAR